MLYVLDASVVIKWLVPELHSDRAERFIAAFRAGKLDFIAPDIVSAEVGHSLGRLVVRREISHDACFDALADYLALALPTTPSVGLVSRAARLALDHMGSFYDALYLSLAFERDCPLLTADERMVRAFARIDRLVSLAAAPDPLEAS